jgi:hypothetical protein
MFICFIVHVVNSPPPPFETTTTAHSYNTPHDTTCSCPTVVPMPCRVSSTPVHKHNTPLALSQHTKSANSACPVIPTWLTRTCHTLHQPHRTTTRRNLIVRSSDMSQMIYHPVHSPTHSISTISRYPGFIIDPARLDNTTQHNTTQQSTISFHSIPFPLYFIPNSTIHLIEYHVLLLLLHKFLFPHFKPEPDQVKSLTYLLTY